MLSNFLIFFQFWELEYISNPHLIMRGLHPLTSQKLRLCHYYHIVRHKAARKADEHSQVIREIILRLKNADASTKIDCHRQSTYTPK